MEFDDVIVGAGRAQDRPRPPTPGLAASNPGMRMLAEEIRAPDFPVGGGLLVSYHA